MQVYGVFVVLSSEEHIATHTLLKCPEVGDEGGRAQQKVFVDSSSHALESLHKWGVPLCYPYSCCCPWSSMLRYFSFNAFLDLSDMISSAVCQWSLMLHYILNAISGSLGYDQAQIEF